MPDIILNKGTGRLEATLSLDMGPYCEACKVLRQQRLALKSSEKNSEIGVLLAEQVALAETNFLRVSTEYRALTDRLHGVLYWPQIKDLISKQCNHDDSAEHRLFMALTKQDSSRVIEPLAMIALNDGFRELLKNSMDALLKRYLTSDDAGTMLTLSIAMALEESNLKISVTDNAGGFSETYLTEFPAMIASKAYKVITKHTDEKIDADGMYFGGQGRGMCILCNTLLDGEMLDNPGFSRARYLINPGDTSIHISNEASTNGAKIELLSPLVPPLSLSVELGMVVSPVLPSIQIPRTPKESTEAHSSYATIQLLSSRLSPSSPVSSGSSPKMTLSPNRYKNKRKKVEDEVESSLLPAASTTSIPGSPEEATKEAGVVDEDSRPLKK